MTGSNSSTLNLESRLQYFLSTSELNACANCGLRREEHVDDKCLYEASKYNDSALRQFIVELLRNGGDLEIRTTSFTFKQRVIANAADERSSVHTGSILAYGKATLNAKDRT